MDLVSPAVGQGKEMLAVTLRVCPGTPGVAVCIPSRKSLRQRFIPEID